MNRQEFLKLMALMPLVPITMKLNALNKIASTFDSTTKMPALFLGHGSPMNAIEENEFVVSFRKLGVEIVKPKAILCISAHWETNGTFVTAMPNPRTIHDFGGFPKELYEIQYPAPGSPELAIETKQIVKKADVNLDDSWGLDHGAWSVIKHLYPNADIPIIQMSLDYTKPAQYHFELAKELSILRERGILIVESGNMFHNLRLVDWKKLKEQFAFDWAAEANEKMKHFIINEDFDKLINYHNLGNSFKLAIPTPEHYLPLLYTLALKQKNEKITIFNYKPVAGSLTMTSLKLEVV